MGSVASNPPSRVLRRDTSEMMPIRMAESKIFNNKYNMAFLCPKGRFILIHQIFFWIE